MRGDVTKANIHAVSRPIWHFSRYLLTAPKRLFFSVTELKYRRRFANSSGLRSRYTPNWLTSSDEARMTTVGAFRPDPVVATSRPGREG